MNEKSSQANGNIRKFIKSLAVVVLLSACLTIFFCLILPAASGTSVLQWKTCWWFFIAFCALSVVGLIFERINLVDRLISLFFKNPIAWILLGLFITSEYKGYRDLNDLHKLCDLTGEHDVMTEHPRTTKDIIDNICLKHEQTPEEVDH